MYHITKLLYTREFYICLVRFSPFVTKTLLGKLSWLVYFHFTHSILTSVCIIALLIYFFVTYWSNCYKKCLVMDRITFRAANTINRLSVSSVTLTTVTFQNVIKCTSKSMFPMVKFEKNNL